MITRVVMPKLTDTMEEGVVVAWKKHEGETVDSGDVLAEIETDKAVLDLEAFGSGVLRKVLVPEGETVKAGKLIAVIGEQDDDLEATLAETSEAQSDTTKESAPKPGPKEDTIAGSKEKPASKPAPEPAPAKSEKAEEVKKGSAEAKADKSEKAEEVKKGSAEAKVDKSEKAEEVKKGSAETKADTSPERRIKASPRAKALAKEEGLDLSGVKGSGPEGRIVEADVQGKLEASKGRERKAQDIPLSQMRKAIARVTTSSKAPVPHFYLTTEVAMDQAERLRKQMEEVNNSPLSLTVLFVRAAALALARHPEINVSFMGETLRRHATIDIGIAVALEEGLITPVIRDCAGKNILQVAEEVRDLFVRAKGQQLAPEEYAGATFSISNLGMYEVDNFIAVLMPPQAASLAIGAVNIVPVARGRAIKLSRRMKVTLSCDHRALDGAQGARFLQSFKRALEKPLELFLPLKTPSTHHKQAGQ